MNKIEAKELLRKYAQGTCTEAERSLFEQWYIKLNREDHLQLTETELEEAEHEMLLRATPVVRKKVVLWPYIAATACVLLCVGIAFYFYQSHYQTGISENQQVNSTIVPGSNKAVLTLSDGSKISLTDAATGELTEQEGISISKTADGQLVYKINDRGLADDGKVAYNTVETPRGGQHQIILPDGSKVWLNASSKLKFPASFVKATQRKVELSGEAYFEVAKDKAHPFIVATAKQEVEVLGTQFNINSYVDEDITKTTLLEGSVRLSLRSGNLLSEKSFILKPGQQAWAGTTVNIRNIDATTAIDWKNGMFIFDKESLGSIMRKISRWYDIDVVFQNEQLKTELYGGMVSRFSTVTEVLEVLELTDLAHFKIVGRSIMVTK